MAVDGSAFVASADAILALHGGAIQAAWSARCRRTMEKAVVIIDPLPAGKKQRLPIHMALMSETEARHLFRQSVAERKRDYADSYISIVIRFPVAHHRIMAFPTAIKSAPSPTRNTLAAYTTNSPSVHAQTRQNTYILTYILITYIQPTHARTHNSTLAPTLSHLYASA
jgi:hypothetical protein